MSTRTKKGASRVTDSETSPAESDPETSPAEAAAAEAVGDSGPVVVPFRDAEFTIDRDVFGSARLLMAVAQGRNHKILVELLSPADVDRFVALLKRGEAMPDVASEFLDAVNKAAGWGDQGNS